MSDKPKKGFLNNLKNAFEDMTDPKHYNKAIGITPFMTALKRNDLEAVEKMLKNKFDPNVYTLGGLTPLQTTVKKDLPEMAELLIKYNADINMPSKSTSRDTAMDIAIIFNKPRMVSLLAHHGADLERVGDDGWAALHRAAAKGRTDVIKALLNLGAKANTPTADNRTPLSLAISWNRVDSIQTMLSYDDVIYDLNKWRSQKSEMTFLQTSILQGKEDIARTMVNAGANVNTKDKNGCNALHIAVDNGHFNLVEPLIKAGADIGKATSKNFFITPFHILCMSEYPKDSVKEAAKIMLEYGVSPNQRTKLNETALSLAARNPKQSDLISLLLSYNARTNVFDNLGETPLLKAIDVKNKAAIEILIKEGKADVNLANKKTGDTPLFEAISKQDPEIVSLLLQSGAKADIKNKKDLSAIDLAKGLNNPNILSLLEKHNKPQAGIRGKTPPPPRP